MASSPPVLLLGAEGYVGRAFARELRGRGGAFVPLAREALDYTRFEVLFDYVRKLAPGFVINAADHPGGLGQSLLEPERLAALEINAILPQTVARVCLMTHTPWGHVSSGDVYVGAKRLENGVWRIERDLTQAAALSEFAARPEHFAGFNEGDPPNRTFREPPCDAHAGAKALAEEGLLGPGRCYIWRLRHPFSELDDPGNYLSQLQRRTALVDGIDSLAHLGDAVRGCLELWERRAPFGIFNVCNPGAVTTRTVAGLMERYLRTGADFQWLEPGEAAAGQDARGPHALLDTTKLRRAGVELRPVSAALEHALGRWRPAVLAGNGPACAARGGGDGFLSVKSASSVANSHS